MKIGYKNNKLKKNCSSLKDASKAWGKQIGAKVVQRLAELAAFSNLEEVPPVPPFRRHKLTGKRKDEWAVGLTGKDRLTFLPEKPFDLNSDKSIILSTVKAIIITDVGDYHG